MKQPSLIIGFLTVLAILNSLSNYYKTIQQHFFHPEKQRD